MTIPVPATGQHDGGHYRVELYPHDPASLIPLLERYTPRSLPALCTIRENLSRPSTSTSTEDCKAYEVVYATFQPAEAEREGAGEEQGAWAVVVQMQDPAYTHLRLYASWEHQHPPKDKQGEEGEGWMGSLAEAIAGVFGKEVILGAVDSRWNAAMRKELDAGETVECATFLAPPPPPPSAQTGREREEEDAAVRTLGLGFDHARPQDIDLIQSTCDVPRPREYYTSRAHHTTVLRTLPDPLKPSSSGSAVCWIMHHSDGALGALYTVPAWRRRGLAKMVVSRRIADRRLHLRQHTAGEKQTGTEQMAQDHEYEYDYEYCHVFRGNQASEALWLRMGWKAAWGVKWIVNRELDRRRGKVVIHRDDHDHETRER